MISAPAGGAAVVIAVTRSLSTMMYAFATTLPFGSTTLPALIAFVAANVGAPRSTSSQARTAVLRIPRPRFFELCRDIAHERVGGDHACERAEAENPALERAIQADVERQAQPAGAVLANLLRRMPLAAAHVVGDRRLKLDFHVFGRA